MADKSVVPDYIYTVDFTRTQCYVWGFFTLLTFGDSLNHLTESVKKGIKHLKVDKLLPLFFIMLGYSLVLSFSSNNLFSSDNILDL